MEQQKEIEEKIADLEANPPRWYPLIHDPFSASNCSFFYIDFFSDGI